MKELNEKKMELSKYTHLHKLVNMKSVLKQYPVQTLPSQEAQTVVEAAVTDFFSERWAAQIQTRKEKVDTQMFWGLHVPFETNQLPLGANNRDISRNNNNNIKKSGVVNFLMDCDTCEVCWLNHI